MAIVIHLLLVENLTRELEIKLCYIIITVNNNKGLVNAKQRQTENWNELKFI